MASFVNKTLTAILLVSSVRVAGAQDAASRFAGGVTAGTMTFSGGRSEQAMSVLLEYRPAPWLFFSASPGYGRTTFGSLSSTGPTDIPLAAAARYSAAGAPWSPAITGSLSDAISTAQSGSTLGIGRNAVVAGAGLSVAPLNRTYLSADVSHPLTSASGNGSADVWVSRSLGFATPSLGYSAEIGTADSAATLARSVAGGISFPVAGPLSVAIDGGHGLTSGAPRWTFSVSFGTAYGGISSVSGGSLFGRLKNAFGSRATSSSGYSKSSTGGSSCRKVGTC